MCKKRYYNLKKRAQVKRPLTLQNMLKIYYHGYIIIVLHVHDWDFYLTVRQCVEHSKKPQTKLHLTFLYNWPDSRLIIPPSAVDYPATTSYYWPDIVNNVTQVSIGHFRKVKFSQPSLQLSGTSGLDTWEPEPVKGPFGFNAALSLDGTQVSAKLKLSLYYGKDDIWKRRTFLFLFCTHLQHQYHTSNTPQPSQ